MVSDWPQMETMHLNGEVDNSSDLFGGDLFSDELLDIYNSSEGADDSTGHEVPLSNDMPHYLEQDNDGAGMNKNTGSNMAYGDLGELKSSPSMNDFTSILEEGHTPTKAVDSMLAVTKKGSSKVNSPASSGKKRAAETSQANPAAKKKTNAKACSKAGTKGGAAAAGRRAASNSEGGQKVNGKNNASVSGNNMTAKKEEANVVIPSPEGPTATVAPKANQTKAQATQVIGTNHPGQVLASVKNPVKTPKLAVPAASGSLSPVSSKGSVSSGKTEESFKGVAQAAVNNLILSAGQGATRYEPIKADPNFIKPVDTSTAHVAALTSTNWVAACAASISDAPPGSAEADQAAALAAASDPAAAKAARARRASLTADERARQNRDRNREHARNTRLRKKAYVEELKRTLTELVTARDASELERRHEKQRELEVREVRYRVMEEFLKLRARGSEANLLARWVAILEDGFTLTIPKTDYRGMVHNALGRQVSSSSVDGSTDSLSDPTVQVLRGPSECFDDASKIAAFLQSLSTATIVQTYNCDRKKFMMDGINAMLEWTLTATMCEDPSPIIVLKGCMRATFSPASNKLVCAELLFDSGSVVNQVKSLVSYQDVTDALLDSVLPQAPPVQSTKQEGILPCSVSVASTDKGESSSDDEGLHQQQVKQES